MPLHVNPYVDIYANGDEDDGKSPCMSQAIAQVCSFGTYPAPIATDGDDFVKS